MRRGTWLACAAALAAVAGCRERPADFDRPQRLGGVEVPASTLNRGAQLYRQYCVSCHGRSGLADGPNAAKLDPRPTPFAHGRFRHASGGPDALPSDQDLLRVLKAGSPGTAMPSWAGLGEADLLAIIQFIKTLSDRWRTSAAAAASSLQPSPMAATVPRRLVLTAASACRARVPTEAGTARGTPAWARIPSEHHGSSGARPPWMREVT